MVTENPGTDKVERLLIEVHDGNYVIPYFQRGFEWEPRMVCDLFESILQDYFIGLILLWELNAEDAKNEKWDPVWGVEETASTPSTAILDGQQRLSSLYFAIYNPEVIFPNRKSYYSFYIDLTKILNRDYENAVDYKYHGRHRQWRYFEEKMNESTDSGIIPISILSAKDPANSKQKYIDSTVFSVWLEEYVSENKEKLPEDITTQKAYQVFNRILNYPFVIYPLSSDRELGDICNIFARVNEKGMKLSTFDLMNAFLYPKGVSLRKELWENYDNPLLKSVDTNMNVHILRVMSLKKQNYCSSKFLYNLIPGETTQRKGEDGKMSSIILINKGEEFEQLWWSACKYAEKAREIIMNTGDGDLGAIKTGFIPNTTILPVLAAILSEYSGDLSDSHFKTILNKWYWSAVFLEDYGASSDSIMAKDYRDWKDWFTNEGEIERSKELSHDFVMKELNIADAKKWSAIYNAILCTLALNNARDFYTGRIVGTGDYSTDSIDDHHIFPSKVKGLEPSKCKEFDSLKDSILNRTLLLNDTDKQISTKKPSTYISEMLRKHGNEEKVISILETHLISHEAYGHLKSDDFDAFIGERERTIKRHLLNKLGLDNDNST